MVPNMLEVSMLQEPEESARVGTASLHTFMIVGILMGNPMLGVIQWSPRDGSFVTSEHVMSVTKTEIDHSSTKTYLFCPGTN